MLRGFLSLNYLHYIKVFFCSQINQGVIINKLLMFYMVNLYILNVRQEVRQGVSYDVRQAKLYFFMIMLVRNFKPFGR